MWALFFLFAVISFGNKNTLRYKNQGILIKTISVNCNVNSCQFEVKFCFWVIRMQHVALVTQNKMDFFVTKIRAAPYKNK